MFDSGGAVSREDISSRIWLSKGEMFDSGGAVSGEVDILIYDTVYSTVFHDGSGKILAPVESCYGAIECKSTLTTGELEDCIRKIAKYRAMQRPEAKQVTFSLRQISR